MKVLIAPVCHVVRAKDDEKTVCDRVAGDDCRHRADVVDGVCGTCDRPACPTCLDACWDEASALGWTRGQ